jgi:carboxyl-terminal processing protease
MERAPSPWWKPFPLTLVLAAAFLGGAVAERNGWLSFLPGHSQYEDLGPEFDSVVETWQLIKENYPDREAAAPDKLAQAAIDGMLAELGDTGHTAFLSAKDADELDKSIDGSFEGIGAVLTMKKPTAVATIMPGSPAQAAGLRPGDIFLQVDGKDVSSQPADEIVRLVRGPAGKPVQLRMSRPGVAEAMDFTVTRAKVEVPQVSWHMLPGVPVAHIAIKAFGKHVHVQLKEALREATAQGARGLILDLRRNPGGLRDQAVLAASEFLPGGNVLLEEDSRGKRAPVPVKPGGMATTIPIAVLVDEATVSAGEIFAAAMQDYQRGPVVGTQTLGTGTILQTFRLRDGSAVNMAVAKWLTPNGRSLWHQGLKPDVEVKLPITGTILRPDAEETLDADGLARCGDAQLLKALELLRERLPAQ